MNKTRLAYCTCCCCIVLFSAILFGGCEYKGLSILPSYIKKIHITPFSNKSFRPDLPEKMLLMVNKEFIADGRLLVCEENKADAILYGEISRYDLEPLSYSAQMKVEEYKVRIIVTIWLKDMRGAVILWKEEDVGAFITASSTLGGIEVKVENEAIDEVVEKIARKIVKRVIDGWT